MRKFLKAFFFCRLHLLNFLSIYARSQGCLWFDLDRLLVRIINQINIIRFLSIYNQIKSNEKK